MMNNEEQHNIDAVNGDATGTEIRISDQDFRVINQLINQKCQKLYSALEETVIQQSVNVGNHCSQLIQNFQQGIYKLLSDEHVEQCQRINRVDSKANENENFQFKLLEQYEELKDELKSLINSLSCQKPSMDLTREPPPSLDRDFNGCPDGVDEIEKIREENKKKLLKDQNKLMQEIKDVAKKSAINTNTTLQNKANKGDMDKFNIKSKKPAPNAEQVPGSPESATNKNKINSNSNHFHQKEQMDTEFDEFYPITYPKVDNVPIVETDPTTGRQKIRMEEKHFHKADDYGFDPSPSAKKRMRKRRTNDAKRAKCEVVVHNLEETVREEYSSNELFWVAESNKFLQWIRDEMHPEHIGNEVGIDLGLEDVVKTSRIYVLQEYYDEGNPLPMIVQLKDENTANKIKKAMYSAGCYERRVRRNYGRYKKVGDKKKDKEIDDNLLNLPYGRPSTTKAERDLAKKKKEYKSNQSFKHKTTFQEFKKEMDVDYIYLNKKYTKNTKDGIVKLFKKPKSVSNKATYNEKGYENDQIYENDPDEEELYNPTWFEGDYCRVKCAFDGQIHEAKLLKQNTENPLVFKLYVLGYGYKEDINCSLFKKTRGDKAQKAQIEAVANSKKIAEENSKKIVEETGNGTSDATSTVNSSPNLRQEKGENDLESELKELKELEKNLTEIHPAPSPKKGISRKVEEIDSKSKNKFLELKEILESEFAIDLKSIDNLDDSGSSLLRDNSLENDDIENTENIDEVIFNGRTAPLSTSMISPEETEMTDGRTALPAAANANKTNAYQQGETEMKKEEEETHSLNNTAAQEPQSEGIEGFTKLLSKDLLNSANNSFNYKDYIESEEFENIYEKISDTKAAVNHQEMFERMKTRSGSLNKDNIILKPTTPLRRTTSVQNKRPQK